MSLLLSDILAGLALGTVLNREDRNNMPTQRSREIEAGTGNVANMRNTRSPMRSRLKGLLENPQVMQGLGLLGAGSRGIDPLTAQLQQAKTQQLLNRRAKPGKLITVFDKIKGENVLMDENLVRMMPQRFGVKLSDSVIKERAKLSNSINLLNSIEKNYIATGKAVGTIDPDRIKGFFAIRGIGDAEGGERYAALKNTIGQMTTFLTQAISGAAVSKEEAERIKKLIPQVSDSEVMFESKLKSLRRYLTDARKNYGGDIETAIRELPIGKYLKTIKDDKRAKSKQDFEKLGDDPLGIL